jgi:pentatricopeptide repeat protein
MKGKGIVPDAITYGIVMSAYDKAGMIREMLELVKDIKNNQITMNYIHYSLIIGAYYKNNSWGQVLNFFEMAVKDSVCKPNLGYDFRNNALNFHLDAVFNLPVNHSDHIEGVSRDLARALFKYHMERGKIKVGTTLIVGYRGSDTLKNLFINIIEEEYPNFSYNIPDTNLGIIELHPKSLT